MDDPLLANLTPAQQEAVLHVDGPLLILAGPGSGKTRVVTHRIAHLLRTGIAAQRILALTFTNKAAEEMRRRVERLAPGKPVWVSTFHRFCAKLLREHGRLVGLAENFTIYDTSDSQSTLKRTIDLLDVDIGHFTPQQIAHHISWAKNNLIPAAQYQPRPGHPLGAVAAKIYPAYQQALLKANAVDFDDMLLHVAVMLRENPEVRTLLDARYRYILVDEYQDTNLAQYAIVRALSMDYPNLSVTGDPDQSIYGWRGANLSNILEFENDYPDVHVVRLEQNYRSTKAIVRAAASLIAYNKRRKEKDLFTDNGEGDPVRLTTYFSNREEAETIAARIASEIRAGRRRPRDFAVFYRVNALSRSLEFAFRDAAVPYQIVNGVEFFQRAEIKDVMAYLRLLNNPADDEAFMRVVNTPTRGIGKTSLKRLAAEADARRIPLLDLARHADRVEGLGKKPAGALIGFAALVDRLARLTLKPIEELMRHVLSESGYQEHLKQSDAAEDEERLANVEELLTVARDFDEKTPGEGRLEEFLEEICLVNDTDFLDGEDDRVTLMTLHASKGLEFPVVFLTAVEHGLLPHERSREHPDELEEERRLMFVGMTRAQEELNISLARYREFRGQRRLTVPSQFLMELPVAEFERNEAAERVWETFADYPPARDDDHVHAADDHDHTHDAASSDAGDDDISFDTDSFDAPAKPKPGAAPAPTYVLQTAADLAGAAPAAAQAPAGISPDLFHQGMVVRHPEYGIGKILALSGAGLRRMATVAFPSHGQKKFMLSASPLRPVKS
ncbi:MAG: UvrD-helicase domain-containing protein [Planctomycetaceae bacterium]|nr:UvrD-helicase domain-containing protein [Planctomycetaceae bacterium]